MKATVLQLDQVSKKIGKKTLVENISFDIKQGEVFGLLGPNGAGKTTIIRSIVGLINRTTGKVHINGIDIDQDFKGAIKEVGAIIENPEFYMYMSGLDNLKQFARMSRKAVTDEEMAQIIERVKLSHAIHQKVKTYSLGMRQRLGVAQALLHNPALLILDEPTNGLDPQGMAEFRDLIRELAHSGTSVLISSHLLSEIQQITDRFAIINQGKLTHIESMSDLTLNARRKYRLVVSDGQKAQSLLTQLEPGLLTIDGNTIEIELEAELVPQIAQLLVRSEIDLLEMALHQASLEERFLTLTNGGDTK
ncbi:ABC transporter ATP-binding protein [Listeria ilorinensis]|uniref:ABC transporter ATP-binding protein n=1 Tax=Listeria ilorinensis TaxID=2867439 RepID=UPI001EF5F34C|nr:ABC transporter ATP-binding protein [Listeria ilorinensis]